MQPIRAVFVGDGAVGKTCLLISQTTGTFPNHIDTQNMEYQTTVKLGEKRCRLTLIDTFGQDEDDRTRPQVYPGTEVFCVCFSIISPYSFENIRKKWVPEISRYAPGKPIILVGCKVDLRDDQDARERLSQKKLAPISFDHASNMKEEIKATKYIECSATQNFGVDTLMEAIVESVVGPAKGKKKTKPIKFKSTDKKKRSKSMTQITNVDIVREGATIKKGSKSCTVL